MLREESGVVLVVVLLYLSVITILISSIFSQVIMQFKMSNAFFASEKAFQSAELALLVAENLIHQKILKGEGEAGNEASYRFERISTESCGMWFYKIYGRGEYANAMKELESTVLLPVYSEDCPEIIEEKRRILWREIGI